MKFISDRKFLSVVVFLMFLHWLKVINVLPLYSGGEVTIKTTYSDWNPSLSIPLVIVVCSNEKYELYKKLKEDIYTDLKRQKDQIRVLLGTLLFFSSSSKWRVILITDTVETFHSVTDELQKRWPKHQLDRLILERRSIKIHQDEESKALLQHYRPCAWQKVFLDKAFPDLDSIVFLDSDILFTGPAEDLWTVFTKFDTHQAIAVAPEPWYLKGGDRPYGGKVGLNTGTLVMNLTRLRGLKEGSLGDRIFQEFKTMKQDPRHDQDMINIVLKKNPELLYELSYRWNFIPSDCSTYAPECDDCNANGISIVHGADASFFRLIDGKYKGLFLVMSNMTELLQMSAHDVLNALEYFMIGIESIVLETICSEFEMFIPWTTHHLRLMEYVQTPI